MNLLAALVVLAPFVGPQDETSSPKPNLPQTASPSQTQDRFSTGPLGSDLQGPRLEKESSQRRTPGTPTSKARFDRSDVRVNQDSSGNAQNEPGIAVNPQNPLNLIAAGNDYRTGNVQTGHYASFDGGLTWIGGVFPVKPGFSFSGDAVAAFDHLGNAYIICMQYFGPGGSAVYAYKSVNGGATWDNGTEIDLDPSNDKPQVSVDSSNGPHRGTVLVAWDRFGAPGGDHIYVSSTSNQGASWSASQRINGSSSTTTISPDVAFGANSVAYVMWADRGRDDIFVDRSFDGGNTWGTDILVAPMNSLPSPLPGSSFRTFDIFTIAADATSGPYSGNVYVAWHDWNGTQADVLFSRSINEGASWSSPMLVNDEPRIPRSDQFFPWMDTDVNGNVNVLFYDRRDDPSDFLIHSYVARSSDGGQSFRANLRLSDVSWDHQNDFGGGFIGDYIGASSSANGFHGIWCDARSGGQDLYSDRAELNFFTDVDTISVGTGGQAQFTINVGPNLAGRNYIVLGSASGTTPGFDLNGINVPLNFDPFLVLTVSLANSAALANTLGVLDATGSATATLDTLGPLDPVFNGIDLDFAVLVFGPSAEFATNPTRISFGP